MNLDLVVVTSWRQDRHHFKWFIGDVFASLEIKLLPCLSSLVFQWCSITISVISVIVSLCHTASLRHNMGMWRVKSKHSGQTPWSGLILLQLQVHVRYVLVWCEDYCDSHYANAERFSEPPSHISPSKGTVMCCGIVQYLNFSLTQGAAKRAVCFRKASWCYVVTAPTLAVSLRETHLETNSSLITSFTYCKLTWN